MFKRSSPHCAAPVPFPARQGLVWIVGVTILVVITGCAGASFQPTPTVPLIPFFTATPSAASTPAPAFTVTPTPTLTILGATLTPEPTAEPSELPTLTVTPEQVLTITGSDQNDSASTSDTFHNSIHIVAEFSLKTVGGTRLNGTAAITFRQTEDVYDPKTNCQFNYDSGDLRWNADLDGQYEKQSDGSLYVTFTAKPTTGPSYTPKDCLGSNISVAPAWAGAAAVLINGHYNQRSDIPCTINAETKCQASRILIMDVTAQH